MSRAWNIAVARARDGFAVLRPRPTTIVKHLVDVRPRECADGILRYEAYCSCGNWLCTDADTDAEARQRARADHESSVQFTTRSEMPFAVHGRNGWRQL